MDEHLWLADLTHKGPVMRNVGVILIVSLDRVFNNASSCRTPSSFLSYFMLFLKKHAAIEIRKCCPRYWSFVLVICQWLVGSIHKNPELRSFMLDKLVDKVPMWRHCNEYPNWLLFSLRDVYHSFATFPRNQKAISQGLVPCTDLPRRYKIKGYKISSYHISSEQATL